MRIIIALLLIALVIPFAGCDVIGDAFNREANRITELEARISELEAANKKLQANWNEHAKGFADEIKKLNTENKTLRDENAELRGHVTSLNFVLAKIEDAKVNKPVQAVFQVNFDHNGLYNKTSTMNLTKDVLAMVNKHGRERIKIKVEGYASKAGSAKINKWFSEERAEGVAHKLFSAGINESIVEIIAHGETDDDERKVIVTVEVLE